MFCVELKICCVTFRDFLQLPPVNVKKFAFETQAWKDAVHETVVLKKVFRQKLVGFISLLNRLRIGHLTPLDINVLNHCKMTVFPNDGIKATRLFPHKASCDQLNQAEVYWESYANMTLL